MSIIEIYATSFAKDACNYSILLLYLSQSIYSLYLIAFAVSIILKSFNEIYALNSHL